MQPSHAVMPVVLNPSLTTRQVRAQASLLLPGAQVRQLVFWRYLLLWQKPFSRKENVSWHADYAFELVRGNPLCLSGHDPLSSGCGAR